jgi:hypothetical protein
VAAKLKQHGLTPKPDSKPAPDLSWKIADPDGFRVGVTGNARATL